MNSITRNRIAIFVAITLLTLAVIVGTAHQGQATPQHRNPLPPACKALKALPSYKVKGEDGIMTIPSGRALVRELREMHASAKRMHQECSGWLGEWADAHLNR